MQTNEKTHKLAEIKEIAIILEATRLFAGHGEVVERISIEGFATKSASKSALFDPQAADGLEWWY